MPYHPGKQNLLSSGSSEFFFPLCDPVHFHRPFAASNSRGTKPPCWRTKVALGPDKQKAYIILNGNFLCLSCPNGAYFATSTYTRPVFMYVPLLSCHICVRKIVWDELDLLTIFSVNFKVLKLAAFDMNVGNDITISLSLIDLFTDTAAILN